MKDKELKQALTTLSKSKNVNDRKFAAKHPQTPKQRLLKLAKDRNPDVRLNLLRRDRVSQDLLNILYNDKNADVKISIIHRGNVPEHVMLNYAKDNNEQVLDAALNNANGKVIEVMCQHPLPKETALRIIKDNILPATAQMNLLKNQPILVEKILNATKSKKVLQHLATHKNPKIRQLVVEDDYCPEEIKAQLATDPNQEVRLAVAENTKNKETLKILATDKNADVRIEVADRYRLTEEIIRILSHDTNQEVQKNLTYHKLPEDCMLNILNRNPTTDAKETFLEKHNIPDRVLAKLSNDHQPDIRDEAVKRIQNRLKRSKMNQQRRALLLAALI